MKYIIVILSIALLFNNCTTQTTGEDNTVIEKQQLGLDEIEVKVEKISNQNFCKELLSNGKLTALQKADLHFRVSETIEKIYVKNGDNVTKSQPLVRLNTILFDNSILQAKAQLDKSIIERRKQIIEFGFTESDTSQIPEKIIKNINANSGYNEAYAQYKQAMDNKSFATLVAPFNGIVANITSKEHNTITSTEIFCTVLDNSIVEAKFQILESDAIHIKTKQSVLISPIAFDSIVYNGYITEINPIVDNNGLITVKAQVKNSDKKLIDGMNVKITIRIEISNTVTVPKSAVVIRSGKEVAFTYTNGLAKWNWVTTTAENTTHYQIKEGLKKGDSIIISNNINLAHDSKVKKKVDNEQ